MTLTYSIKRETHTPPKANNEYQDSTGLGEIVTSGSAASIQPVSKSFSKALSFVGIRNKIFDQIRNKNKEIALPEVQATTEEIINLLEKSVSPFNLIELPNIFGSIRDDGSFLMEWYFDHYFFGISVETNVKESSWHFVSDEKFGYFSASGDTQNEKFSSILEWLVPFIVTKKDE